MIKRLTSFFHKGDKDSSFVLKKSFLALAVRLGGMVTQYLFIFIVARLYGPKEQGAFTLCFTVLQLFAIFSQMGLDNRLTRIIAAHKDQADSAIIKTTYIQSLRLTLFASSIWAIATFFSAPFIAGTIFSKPEITDELQQTCMAFVPFVIIGLNSAGYRGFKNMTGFLIFKAIQPLLSAILLLVLFYMKSNWGVVHAYTYATLGTCLISIITWYRFSKMNESAYQPTLSWNQMLGESMPMMLTGSMFFILGWTDNIILGIFRTSEEVGMYDAAFKLSTLSAIVLLAINAIQAPVFSDLYQKKEMGRLQQIIIKSNRLLFFTSLPLTLLLCIFPETILGFLGEGFKGAWIALILLAIGNFINSITGSIGILLQMSGHQKQYNKIITTTAIGSIVLNFILIPNVGILGAAISSSAAKIIQNLLSVVYAKKHLGIISIYLPGIEKLKMLRNKNATK
jgi:O-antigen/teichoic acid export membrane protein